MRLNKNIEQPQKKARKSKKGGSFLDDQAQDENAESENETEFLEPTDSDLEFIDDSIE